MHKLARIASLVVIILTVLCNAPLAKLQHKFQSKLMVAQDDRLKATSESLVNMKVLKLYTWESHLKNVIENLRKVECKWLSTVQMRKAYNGFLFWASPVLVSTATFGACYFLGVPLHASNVFTFVATLRLVQELVRCIPDVIGVVIQAKVAFARIVKFLEAPELENPNIRQIRNMGMKSHSIFIKSASFSWEESPLKPTLRNTNLEVRAGEKVAICGEVGSGKSTLLAAVLGEIPNIQGTRIQLARALYQDADIYLLDDPFSAVDAHTCSSLFNEYVMAALSMKTVLLVTHQVDFLPAFDSVLLMSDGEILHAAPHHQLLASSREFQDLVNAHKETGGAERLEEVSSSQKRETSTKEIRKTHTDEKSKEDQLIKQEEREVGGIGLKPYMQYLNQNKGYLFFSATAICHIAFVIGSILQNSWMAANVENPNVTTLRLIVVYLVIGFTLTPILLFKSLSMVALGMQSSKSLFSPLQNSIFRAPMSFYDTTPLGRILSRVSANLSIVDLDVPFGFIYSVVSTINTYANLAVLAVVTWQVLFLSILMIYLAILLQRYYFSAAKELMRINGITKSFVANHLAESIAGLMMIRAFGEEDRFFVKNLDLVDINASPFFQCFGFVGMTLSYGLSLNISLVFSIQNQCALANLVERLNQSPPPANWPTVGKVEIQDLKIRYRPNAPLVLRGITCTFEEGHKIGIVGRTGSGKSTLIGALFRLVEPTRGKIVIDEIDISTLRLHDLRSRFGIIPQDPTLFNGIVRYNLDPLGQHTDQEIWEVLGKCQLGEVVQEKEAGLDSMVVQDGSNWSMGQRQLFCLGRALLRRSKILVLDEATASIDNATDLILQRTIRIEFADCTVITVAHRIPTVMDCTMVLAISDGKLVEYDELVRLMKRENSLFGLLVKEYWSHYQSTESHLCEVNGSSKTESFVTVTPFAKARFFNKMTFWWLNPLMKMRREKTLEDEDIPKLREEDQAQACYSLFTEKFNERK
ncbi:ABC transporter C family member 10 [Camellia lanceoleosa]|uniref:ABC transporter C family member 10 n=1 Tax=Camellia lanceoleosa TaxID=1840588 RepID=A0ACC0H352_9ERIC|nr:ABC transporter C family member 10 [Camellia lanceoleosa]